jgi:hypothetical protein
VQGERVLHGHAYIAPGGYHLSLARSGANYVAQVDQEPPVAMGAANEVVGIDEMSQRVMARLMSFGERSNRV